MSKDKKISADDLTRTGKGAPVELEESDLDQASGGFTFDGKIDKSLKSPDFDAKGTSGPAPKPRGGLNIKIKY